MTLDAQTIVMLVKAAVKEAMLEVAGQPAAAPGELLDSRDVAKRLGVSRGMAYLIMNSHLPCVRMGRSVRVRAVDVDAYVRRQTEAA